MEAGRRGMRPDCINASNPFHVCAEYCGQRPNGGKLRSGGGGGKAGAGTAAARNGETSGKGGRHGRRAGVDPTCANASNPFHRCGDYCSSRIGNQPSSKARQIEGAKSVENKIGVVMAENRKVDPRCANASNPNHECSEYCSQRSQVAVGAGGSKSDVVVSGSKGHVKTVDERGVNPKCVNASNPFHRCADYCFQRIHEKA